MRETYGGVPPTRASAFDPLPDEVLQQILYFISPHDLLRNIHLVSKRFSRLGNESLLWRHHCRVDYQYWDGKHRIREKFAGAAGNVDWKGIYIHRMKVDLKTSDHLNRILETRANRIVNFEEIGKFGYDAKDTLLRHCHTISDDNDQLSRKYYARAVLDSIHRAKALEVWSRLARGEDIPVETALAVYDMFVLHEHPGDLLETSDLLDGLAARIRRDYPRFNHMSTRKKALTVVTFLRAHSLLGLDSEITYRDLQNNYIGLALQEAEHPSLPLVSVAIFCAVAQRLGIDARFCAMPAHVHAMVFPPPSLDLDNKPLKKKNSPGEPMYLDPYRSDVEYPAEHLQQTLAQWGVRGRASEFYEHIKHASNTNNLVLRTTRNIIATIQEFRMDRSFQGPLNHRNTRLNDMPFMEMDHAIYSALWANFFLDPKPVPPGYSRHQFVPMLLSRFEKSYPEDVALIERYVLPSYNGLAAEHSELSEALRLIRAVDSTPRQVRTRNSSGDTGNVKFRVGKVFRHRRYRYIAAIIGWDVECGMDSTWIVDHQIDDLTRGRHQSFYHALVEDASIRYVAEDNIEMVEEPDVTQLLKVAGQYFKRYDKEACKFVANFKEEYPDD
ncbi:hypothetical protein ACMFMF_008282 [Clarireedia jacksonii]